MSEALGEPASPRFRVTVERSFTASHQVRYPDGSLEPLHDHRWRVDVTFEGPALNDHAMLIDFVEVREHLDGLIAEFDGRNLNDLDAFANATSTAERVAQHIFDRLTHLERDGCRLYEVQVQEAPGCRARYGR